MNTNLSAEKFENQNLPFKVKRLSPSIGAELLDIDLRKNLNQSTLDMELCESPHMKPLRFAIQ